MAKRWRSLGDRIQQARELRGWTIRELARRAGVPHQRILAIESGQQGTLTVEVMQRLGRALDLDLGILDLPLARGQDPSVES